MTDFHDRVAKNRRKMIEESKLFKIFLFPGGYIFEYNSRLKNRSLNDRKRFA